MSIISDILSGSANVLFSGVKDLVGAFKLSPEKQQQFELGFKKLAQERFSEIENTIRSVNDAKMQVTVEELKQGDKFTKRARPMVVYGGLAFIFINYILVPILARIALVVCGFDDVKVCAAVIDTSPLADLPQEFWYAWGGITGTWSIGRSAERVGINNKVTRAITGAPPPPAPAPAAKKDDYFKENGFD